MILTNEQLSEIVGAGGGLILDGATLTLSQLRGIVSAAITNKGSIIVKNPSGLTAAQLKDLALLAPGQIVFDFTT
jgi:hypothetical protein